MRVTLFRAFPDFFRRSMQIYADHLLRRVRELLGPREQVVDFALQAARVAPKPLRYWDQYVRYQLACRAQAGDVNHVIDHGYAHLLYSLPARTTVVTFHDAAVARVKTIPLRTRLSLRYNVRAMARAARVLADSQTSRKDFLELTDYPEDRVQVIYPGVEDSFRPLDDRESVKRRLGLPPRCVLHVGNSLPYMNVEGVLRAVAHLTTGCGVDARLVRVGERLTPEQEGLVERLGIRDRVTQLGRVPLAQLVELYNGADVLVYPVFYAGFGWPPLEAMACGTPVVCSNRGALPEVVGPAALLVEPDDYRGLAEQVATLLTDDRLRAAYRLKGREQVRRYTWERAAREVLDVYRTLHAA
jgi:glycosyltransferase involved in cell wall biosynthesis